MIYTKPHASKCMTGFAAYEMYQAVKLHFTDKNYDFIRYNGHTNVKADTFINHKSRGLFEKLATMIPADDMQDFIVANFAYSKLNFSPFVSNLVQDISASMENMITFQTRRDQFSYVIESDLQRALSHIKRKNSFATLKDLFLSNKDGGFPSFLIQTIANKISLETFCAIDSTYDLISKWNLKIDDEFVWPAFSLKAQKFTSFLDIKKDNVRKIFLDILEETGYKYS